MLGAALIFCLASDVPALPGLHTEALGFVRQGNVAGARDILDRVRALSPGSAYCDLIDGHCHLADDRKRAEALYQRAVDRARADVAGGDGAVVEGLHATGRLLRMDERWAEAVEPYRRALALRPSSADLAHEAGYVTAKAAFAEGRLKEAAAALRSALGVDGGGVWAPHLHRELAHALGLSGEISSAARYYAAATERGGLPGGWLAIGGAFSALAAHHEGSQLSQGVEPGRAVALASQCLHCAANGAPFELHTRDPRSAVMSGREKQLPVYR